MSGTPSSVMAAAAHVVEAQQQLEHRALAGAAGADQATVSPGATVQVEALQRRQPGA
jgi:hypothetical protein